MKTREEAKIYACEMSSRCLTLEESERRLQYLRCQHEHSSEQQARDFWHGEIRQIDNWLASDKFRNGNFPLGIDELMLELIEWRALMYAFQNVEAIKTPFKAHMFLVQWLIGGTYAVFALLGKLVSKDQRDNSLRNLWDEVQPFIAQDGACQPDEMRHINRQLLNSVGRFTNQHSKAMLYRNTTIAHNEKNTVLKWDEIDDDIQILVRTWSIVGAWSSFGIHQPFRPAEQALSGLGPFFTPLELERLKDKRQEYIHRVIQWSVNHLHSGQRDPAQGIFQKFVVTSHLLQIP